VLAVPLPGTGVVGLLPAGVGLGGFAGPLAVVAKQRKRVDAEREKAHGAKHRQSVVGFARQRVERARLQQFKRPEAVAPREPGKRRGRRGNRHRLLVVASHEQLDCDHIEQQRNEGRVRVVPDAKRPQDRREHAEVVLLIAVERLDNVVVDADIESARHVLRTVTRCQLWRAWNHRVDETTDIRARVPGHVIPVGVA